MIQKRLGRGYCIDTCALIDLWRRHYPPDVFPGLWEDIERLVNHGLLIAPREVLEELRGVDDELLEWAQRHADMFLDPDDDQLREVRAILEDFPDLIDADKETPDADPFLIALAKTWSWTVVTSERPRTSPVHRRRFRTSAGSGEWNASPWWSSSESRDGSTCKAVLEGLDSLGLGFH